MAVAVQAVPSSQPASTFGDDVHTQVERGKPNHDDGGNGQRPDRDLTRPSVHDPSAKHPGAQQPDGGGAGGVAGGKRQSVTIDDREGKIGALAAHKGFRRHQDDRDTNASDESEDHRQPRAGTPCAERADDDQPYRLCRWATQVSHQGQGRVQPSLPVAGQPRHHGFVELGNTGTFEGVVESLGVGWDVAVARARGAIAQLLESFVRLRRAPA